MTTVLLTDAAIHEALLPPQAEAPVPDLASAISEGIRRTRQRRSFTFPWIVSPAATIDEQRRARWLRVGLAAAALAAALAVAAAGARLIQSHFAPPMFLISRHGELLSVPLGGGEPQRIPALIAQSVATGAIRDFSPSPDGRWLATLSGETLEVWEAPEILNGRVAEPLVITPPQGVSIRDLGIWLPDSATFILPASVSGATRLFRAELDSRSLTQVSPVGLHVIDWMISPDGRSVAVVGQQDRAYGVFVVELATATARKIAGTTEGAIPGGGGITFSPDGTQVAYTAAEVGSTSTFVADVDGLTGPRRLTSRATNGQWPDWSPSGEWIALEVGRPMNGDFCAQDVAVIRPDGSDLRVLVRWAGLRGWTGDDNSGTLLAETQQALDDAALGGLVTATVDGELSLVVAHTPDDLGFHGIDARFAPTFQFNPNTCWLYGFQSGYYRGRR